MTTQPAATVRGVPDHQDEKKKNEKDISALIKQSDSILLSHFYTEQ